MRRLLILLFIFGISDAYLDNYIIGTPKVLCEQDDVSLDVLTAKPFIGKCGMIRERTLNPKGVNFAITVVVSFHPSGFITKNDRAFKLQCFYNEPEETVTNSIQVSSLPMVELQDEMNLYSTFGNVKDPRWECSLRNGDGDEHLVIDEKGCTNDPSLIDSIIYQESLMRAHAQSQAFKFADTNQLFFTCQIRLCQKQMNMCEGITPPKCDGQSNSTEVNSTTDVPEPDSDSIEEAEEIESNLDSAAEVTNQTKKRDRRELQMELDVSTPQLLIVDQDERNIIYSTQTCITKSLLPITFIGTISCTVVLTISLYKYCFLTQKSLLFY